jgi:N-acetyl-anhydromuramyl-L-alanine amidase AmpD
MDIGRAEIDQWHRERGFSRIGYHWVIRRNGDIEAGRKPTCLGAHTVGFNHYLGVCLVGGMGDSGQSDCNFTRAQWKSLENLVLGLTTAYPEIPVIGHRDVAAKDCPTFDASAWWSNR